MNIGKAILGIRKDRNMSQEEFGKLFHVTRQTVSNWENEKSYPDLQLLVDMSDMFEISLDKLVKEDNHMVKVIDKERKYGKAGKVILTIISISLIVCVVYGAIWNLKKTSYEKNFQIALEKNNFIQDILEINGKSQPQNSYSKESGNTVYTICPREFPGILKFKFDIPDSKKIVTATCRKNGRIVDLRMDKEYSTATFYRKSTDGEERGEFLNDILVGEGRIKKFQDGEIKETYEDMENDIQISISEMKKLYQDFY